VGAPNTELHLSERWFGHKAEKGFSQPTQQQIIGLKTKQSLLLFLIRSLFNFTSAPAATVSRACSEGANRLSDCL